MEENLKVQIILAAINSSAPRDYEIEESQAEWLGRVAEMTARITAMCGDKSPLSQIVEQVEQSKVFQGVVQQVVKEQSSTRGLVQLKTRPSKFHPDGIEEARTERTDSPIGLYMARHLKSLVGHRVSVWVEVESINNGAAKVRVIRHVEDLGLAPED